MTENEIKWNLNGVIKYLYKKNELGGDDNEKQYQVDNATLDLLEELHQYRAIGTVEECREARERQRAKKPIVEKPYKERNPLGAIAEIYNKNYPNIPIQEAIAEHITKCLECDTD